LATHNVRVAGSPIWLVSGVPGSGKTSVALELCRRYPKAVHLPVDDLRELVRSGLASPLNWTEETDLQFALARRSAARMARDYADAGFAAVIDDVVQEADMDQITPHLGQYRPRKVLLLPTLTAIKERNRRRTNKNFDAAVLDPVATRLYPTLIEGCRPSNGWMVIDSTHLTLEQTVDQIRAAHSLA
jgi:predicted ATPase